MKVVDGVECFYLPLNRTKQQMSAEQQQMEALHGLTYDMLNKVATLASVMFSHSLDNPEMYTGRSFIQVYDHYYDLMAKRDNLEPKGKR